MTAKQKARIERAAVQLLAGLVNPDVARVVQRAAELIEEIDRVCVVDK